MLGAEYRHGLVALVMLGLLFAIVSRRSGCPAASTVVRLAGGGGGSGAGAVASRTCETTTVYESSDFERLWLKNAAAWSEDFCAHADTPQQNANIEKWLLGVAAANATPSAAPAGLDPTVFSKFQTTVTCDDGSSSERTDWIEPLAHGLRHPYNFCSKSPRAGQGPVTDEVFDALFNRSYLLLTNRESVDALRSARGDCGRRECQVFFFDLGATAYRHSVARPGQSWFVRAYAAAGMPFDRIFAWEAQPMPPREIFAEMPMLMKTYSYFNIPTTHNKSDPSHAVNILKSLATPGDFVVFKLDIDKAKVELPILNALIEDPEAVKLVDEFFFEHHVSFPPMRRFWRRTRDEKMGLSESMNLFLSIRKKGIRAHSWV